jgi:hypothetical protein
MLACALGKIRTWFVRLTHKLNLMQEGGESRSQWPRGLRRRFAAARLLILWLRVPLGTWMVVMSVVSCQVEAFATG